MKPRKWFLQIYLAAALLYGILGLIDNSFIALEYYFETYKEIVMAVSFFFFFFNIAALAMFYHHRVEKIDNIIFFFPIYHLITYLFFIATGFILLSINNFYNWVQYSLVTIGFASSLFEIGLSIYLLIKINFFHSK